MADSPRSAALIVAAGRGERAPLGDRPKQYRSLGGKAVLAWAADAFLGHPAIDEVRVVIRGEDREHYRQAMRSRPLPEPVIGGATRQESVARGLEALSAGGHKAVLIHDGVRPFVSNALISRVLAALEKSEAAIPMLAVTDTLRRRAEARYEIVEREGLRRAQTPQGFRFESILAAHRKHGAAGATDDMAFAERAGLSVAEVTGEEINIKLTTAEDFALAEKLASGASDIRTGSGFDVHGFSEGDHVWLCGIRIPHDRGLAGHSDADVGLHALTDAILGAISGGDLGSHFPSSDPQWRGASSHVFLATAAKLAAELGATIMHVDVTLICERPKILEHRESMRARIADILGLSVSRVSVKATTTDGLGFTGRREGIAAQALATLRLPSPVT